MRLRLAGGVVTTLMHQQMYHLLAGGVMIQMHPQTHHRHAVAAMIQMHQQMRHRLAGAVTTRMRQQMRHLLAGEDTTLMRPAAMRRPRGVVAMARTRLPHGVAKATRTPHPHGVQCRATAPWMVVETRRPPGGGPGRLTLTPLPHDKVDRSASARKWRPALPRVCNTQGYVRGQLQASASCCVCADVPGVVVQDFKREQEKLRMKNEKKFSNVTDEMLGRGAKTVYRDKHGAGSPLRARLRGL